MDNKDYHTTDATISKATLLSDILDDVGADITDLYDNTPPPDSQEYALHLNPLLTDAEAEDARFWYFYSRGLMLTTGPPGSGKGLISNMIGYKMRWYFDKNIIMDYKPRPLFAEEYEVSGNNDGIPAYSLTRTKHIKLFNTQFFVGELAKMAEVAMGEHADPIAKKKRSAELEALGNAPDPEVEKVMKKRAAEMRDLTGQWVAGAGRAYFKYSVALFDEAKRYHDKRRPHNPVGLVLSDMENIWRHLDLLMIFMTAYRDELDTVRFMPKVNYEIKCRWSKKYKMTSIGNLYRYTQISSAGVSSFVSKRIPLIVDGSKPRDVLAGRAWKDIYNSFNAIAISAPKSMRG